jgi:6-pyruvoyltetrahydropterin/6-carboxytetrahydropterin synthase
VNICYLSKTVGFDAAYYPIAMDDDQAPRLHGHSFTLQGTLKVDSFDGPAARTDLPALASALSALVGELDHVVLNDLEGLSDPSLMQVCNWVAARLRPTFPHLSAVTVGIVANGESCRLEIAHG